MKQLFLQNGKALLKDVSIPLLEDNNLLVQVCYSFISSGTEVATVKNSEESLLNKFQKNPTQNIEKVIGAVKENGMLGTFSLIKEKMNSYSSIGYSCSGQVIAVGKKVVDFKVGDYVACAGSGFANHAQVVSVPTKLVAKVLDKNFLRSTSVTTIGAIAMQGVRRAQLELGETVCVLGLGLIGQITVQLAKLAGCKVFGIDLNQERLNLAKQLGADVVLNASLIDIENEIKFVTNYKNIDKTIITAASKSGKVIQQAMNITRRKGKVVLVGDVKIDFNRDPFYSKEIDFLISCSYGPGRYDNNYEQNGVDYPYSYVRWTENRNMQLFVDLVEQKKILIDPLISREFEFDKVEAAYSYLRKQSPLGIVFSYDQNQDFSKEDDVFNEKDNYIESRFFALPYQLKPKDIKSGFIGAGGFAKIKLLPILSRNFDVSIHFIVDANSTNLLNVAKLYDAKRFSNKHKSLIADDDVNLVVIATPHYLHFEQSMDALRAGKAVFVEKPAAVTFEQLEKLKKFFEVNKHSLYCVDFNRSFALFNLEIKRQLKKRKNPAIINYRMNVGFIPKDHWIQDEKNGGRIIGEACHIFELFCFLTDSKPISISVESLNPNSDEVLSNDNSIISLKMEDGSCCNLIYTSIGNSAMGKEQMEVFFDGKSIFMKDYKKLQGFGFPVCFNKKVRYPDKGHEFLLNEFVKSAKSSTLSWPIPFERIYLATKISLIANKLALAGGGREEI